MKSGFRIEVSPKSKLGKQLTSLSVHLRNCSDATGVIRRKVWINHPQAFIVEGVWTVRKSGVISFKGKSPVVGDIEYVYGKLTIGQSLVPVAYDVLPHDKTIKLMSSFIKQMYPYVGENLTESDIKLKLSRKELV